MAEPIEVTTISPQTFVDNTSRYAGAQVIYYSEKRKLTFATYVKKSIPFSPNDRYMVIGKGHEYRPDLVANKVYGLSSYWWKILEANGMMDVWEFKAGTNIRIPALVF